VIANDNNKNSYVADESVANKKSSKQNCEMGERKTIDKENYDVPARVFPNLSTNSCNDRLVSLPTTIILSNLPALIAREMTEKYQAPKRHSSEASDGYENVVSPDNPNIKINGNKLNSSISQNKSNQHTLRIEEITDNYQAPERHLSETSDFYQDLVSPQSPVSPRDDVYSYIEDPKTIIVFYQAAALIYSRSQ